MFKHFRVVLRITPRDIGRAFKAAGRFLLRILPALVFFSSLMFTYSAPVYASTSSGNEIVEFKPTTSSPTLTKEQKQSIIDKAKNWYFPNLVDYASTCASSTLSAATKLYEKYSNGDMSLYQYYLDNVCLGMRSLVGSTAIAPYTGWKSANDVILSLDESFIGTDIDWDQVSTDIALKAVQDFIDPTTHEIKKVERAVTNDDVCLPAESVKDHIKTVNKMYFPKNASGKMSYRTDERFHNFWDSYSSPLCYLHPDLYAGRFGFPALGGGEEMYIVLFETLGDTTYYGKYQFHFTVTSEDVYYEDRDEVNYTNYKLNCEYWDMIDGSQDKAVSLETVTSKAPYFTFYFNGAHLTIYTHASYDNYINFNSVGYVVYIRDTFWQTLYKSDLSSSVLLSNSAVQHFAGSLSSHDAKCKYGGVCDMGYYASLTPISTIYTVDTSQIPNNYYITVSGDTIYDYSITNPETGQKDTIQNFITNNYTFTTNNNGDTNIDNGDHNTSIGGSGNGGNGDVNVNVTVNNNIGGGGGGSYDMPDTSFFDDYLDDALKESSGIRKFIADFFDSMPGQITKLICIGLVLAILCRLIGR